MYQLLLRRNKVIAYGNDFVDVYGTIRSQSTGEAYTDVTIAYYDGELPTDIGSARYEYQCGKFVPLSDAIALENGEYTGVGGSKTLYFNDFPQCIMVYAGDGDFMIAVRGISKAIVFNSSDGTISYKDCEWSDTSVTLPAVMNTTDYAHEYWAMLGQKGGQQ